MLTADLLRRFAPRAKPEIVAALIEGEDEIRAAGITTPLRMAHFLSQTSPETGGLTRLEENLRYSAKRLKEVWPRRFPTDAVAAPFANNPEALANKVYGGRLGNSKPGDGWRYRGRGLLQTTGRSNYRAAGYEDDPDALSRPAEALTSALKFWKDNGCNAFADRDDVVGLRKRINGGSNGLEEAIAALRKAKKLLPAGDTFSGDDGLEPSVDKPAEITEAHTIALVQTWLRNLGYAEVGPADGNVGPFTRAAILAYRADKGLPSSDRIDLALVTALATDKEPRKLAPERTDAPLAVVREKVPEARKSFVAKVWSGLMLGGASLYTMVDGVIGNIGAAKTYIAPVRDLLGDVPGWMWAVAIAGMAMASYFYAHKAEKSAEAAFREGARR